jgi:hypothetical protein
MVISDSLFVVSAKSEKFYILNLLCRKVISSELEASREIPRPCSGQVYLLNRFLHFAPVSIFDKRHGGFGRNDLQSFLQSDFIFDLQAFEI